ncbi:carbohydrate-binding module family 18 [Zalerion maritima]|uniref:Carbohydrate-binding module family 18 n=1 Tax=Zalerion maritima TaxID=339359 RepID=A0AAD5WPC4_9PEZI|nr:carbohydrate-binding module family 18 [Zalerion maritima]
MVSRGLLALVAAVAPVLAQEVSTDGSCSGTLGFTCLDSDFGNCCRKGYTSEPEGGEKKPYLLGCDTCDNVRGSAMRFRPTRLQQPDIPGDMLETEG